MKVTITLEDREDGGLRVYSDDLPGLILSHSDRTKVGSDIVPAIDALIAHRRSAALAALAEADAELL